MKPYHPGSKSTNRLTYQGISDTHRELYQTIQSQSRGHFHKFINTRNLSVSSLIDLKSPNHTRQYYDYNEANNTAHSFDLFRFILLNLSMFLPMLYGGIAGGVPGVALGSLPSIGALIDSNFNQGNIIGAIADYQVEMSVDFIKESALGVAARFNKVDIAKDIIKKLKGEAEQSGSKVALIKMLQHGYAEAACHTNREVLVLIKNTLKELEQHKLLQQLNSREFPIVPLVTVSGCVAAPLNHSIAHVAQYNASLQREKTQKPQHQKTASKQKNAFRYG